MPGGFDLTVNFSNSPTCPGLPPPRSSLSLRSEIAWIRNHYMESPFVTSVVQVVVGGVLVFLGGILIGSS